MHVNIHTAALPDATTSISNSAAATVRMGFNPSRIYEVDRIKALVAAVISECELIRDAKVLVHARQRWRSPSCKGLRCSRWQPRQRISEGMLVR
jgi:hypothetical protein